MTRTFTISTSGVHGPRRWWWVRIYPDLEAMRAAAARYHRTADLAEAHAVCQPAEWFTETGTRYAGGGLAGVLRFAATELTGEIVGHELLHAAVAVYRQTVHRDVRLGVWCTGREEKLAYIFGELYTSFAQAMKASNTRTRKEN